MMLSRSYLASSIFEISGKLEKGLITASELCELCLERIKSTKSLNHFITVTERIARQQAKDADSRKSRGKRLSILDGIPLSFKDNFSTKGMKTTCASKMLSNYIPPYNATVVQRLLENGCITMGKTNMDEFAMGSATTDSVFGPTKNPWQSRTEHNTFELSSEKTQNYEFKSLPTDDFSICGGSSGGSAVAVATGSCFGALGSDTGGSTRSPAAMCGIVGLKPTYGTVSRNGLIPLCNSLDVPGILARTVDDISLLFDCIAGFDPCDSTTTRKKIEKISIPNDISLKGLHIGIPKEYECPGMSPEVINIWNKQADAMDKAGAKISLVSLPHTEYSIVCYSVLCCCDVASNFARYDGIQYGHRADTELSTEHLYAASRHEGFGEVVRSRILTGNYFLLKKNYEKYFLKATQVRKLISEDFEKVFQSGVHMLLTPVTLSDATPYSVWKLKSNREHNASDDFCTQPVNMAGLPAVSVPISLSQQGLPLSLQLIGKHYKEKELLTVAKWIEQQVQFPKLNLKFIND